MSSYLAALVTRGVTGWALGGAAMPWAWTIRMQLIKCRGKHVLSMVGDTQEEMVQFILDAVSGTGFIYIVPSKGEPYFFCSEEREALGACLRQMQARRKSKGLKGAGSPSYMVTYQTWRITSSGERHAIDTRLGAAASARLSRTLPRRS